MDKYPYNKDKYEKHPQGGPENTFPLIKPLDVCVFENFTFDDPRFAQWLSSRMKGNNPLRNLLEAYRFATKMPQNPPHS